MWVGGGNKQDPVAHTLVQGKRLLCNDMWGLGLITLSLVVGYTEMEAIKSSLRKLGIPERERGSEGGRARGSERGGRELMRREACAYSRVAVAVLSRYRRSLLPL